MLDSTWAAMVQLETMRFNGGLHIHKGNPDWKGFTGAITPYKELDKRQRAAVCAIRGTLAMDPRKSALTVKNVQNHGKV